MEIKDKIKLHLFLELNEHIDKEQNLIRYQRITDSASIITLTTTSPDQNSFPRRDIEAILHTVDYERELCLYTCPDNYEIALYYTDNILDGYDKNYAQEIIKDRFYIERD